MVRSDPSPEAGTQLEPLTYDLPDAHDDSVRVLAGLPSDARSRRCARRAGGDGRGR
jgi:hypothetical protein